MKRNFIILTIILLVLLTTLACLGSSGRLDETPGPESQSLTIIQNLEKQKEEAISNSNNAQPAETPKETEPDREIPNTSNSSSEEILTPLSKEQDYSVTGTNFGCICSVDEGSITTSLDIKGDQLTYANNVYDKIAENTYKRSYMGYYILVSGEGDQKTETKVDEERSDIIIITADGFISEHYQGSEASPCCYHTYTMQK